MRAGAWVEPLHEQPVVPRVLRRLYLGAQTRRKYPHSIADEYLHRTNSGAHAKACTMIALACTSVYSSSVSSSNGRIQCRCAYCVGAIPRVRVGCNYYYYYYYKLSFWRAEAWGAMGRHLPWSLRKLDISAAAYWLRDAHSRRGRSG